MRRQWWMGALAVVAALAVGAVALRAVRPGAGSAAAGQLTVPVRRTDLRQVISGSGTVQAVTRRQVVTEVGGTVTAVRVADGAQVTSGQVVVVLENPDLRDQLRQAELELRKAEIQLEDAQTSQASGTPQGDSRNQNNVELLQIARDQAALKLDGLRRNVDHLTVRAPIAGTVTGLPQVGTQVSPGTVLFTVLDLSRMEVQMNVDELDLSEVKVGATAEVTIDALPGRKFQGEVVWVAPEGTAQDGVTTFPVRVALRDAQGVRPGMTATVQIPVAERKGVLAVPSEALRRGANGQWTVQVLRPDGTVATVPVQVGLDTGLQAEILSGLQEGDRVVVGSQTQGSSQNRRGFFLPFRGPGGGLRPGGGPGQGRGQGRGQDQGQGQGLGRGQGQGLGQGSGSSGSRGGEGQ